jgi:hypothetical protein
MRPRGPCNSASLDHLRRGKPSACTGGQECFDIILVTAEGGRKKMTNARPHLDGRSLSRPRASPAPIASTPPRNLTGIRIRGGGGCSSRSIASTSGMPLPFAPGANLRTSQAANPVAMAEMPMTSAKPAISLPCAQSMTAPRKRSDRSRPGERRLLQVPISHPPQTPRAPGPAGCRVLALALDRSPAPDSLPLPQAFSTPPYSLQKNIFIFYDSKIRRIVLADVNPRMRNLALSLSGEAP